MNIFEWLYIGIRLFVFVWFVYDFIGNYVL